MAASLLRLHFHDCFVDGCDVSVLLDDDDFTNFTGEKGALPNLNSLRGFDVIDKIKFELELECPETVSCADIIAVAARDSVMLFQFDTENEHLEGPKWQVEMGRMDSLIANISGANTNLPGPKSDMSTLTQKFQNMNLSQKDMVVLSGAHTIGKARCATFISSSRGERCSNPNDTIANLDDVTPTTFDNQYYINLLSGKGLMPSDRVLVANSGDVAELVEKYAANKVSFFEDFKESMLRMGRLAPPAGTRGEVRRNCRVVNN